MSEEPTPGDQFYVNETPFVVIGDAAPDGQPGLWWVCDREDPAAEPVLKARQDILDALTESDRCLDCGTLGPHLCQGVPGGFGDVAE